MKCFDKVTQGGKTVRIVVSDHAILRNFYNHAIIKQFSHVARKMDNAVIGGYMNMR